VTTTRRTQVRNREALLTQGLPDLRTAVLDVLEAGLEASDPALAVDRRLSFDGAVLTADGRPYQIAGRSVSDRTEQRQAGEKKSTAKMSHETISP